MKRLRYTRRANLWWRPEDMMTARVQREEAQRQKFWEMKARCVDPKQGIG